MPRMTLKEDGKLAAGKEEERKFQGKGKGERRPRRTGLGREPRVVSNRRLICFAREPKQNRVYYRIHEKICEDNARSDT